MPVIPTIREAELGESQLEDSPEESTRHYKKKKN
jgi:hypothetical protein